MTDTTVYDATAAFELLVNSSIGECFKVVKLENNVTLSRITDIADHLKNITYCLEGGGWSLSVSKTMGGNFVAELFFSSRKVSHRAQGESVIQALMNLNTRLSNVINIARN